MTDDARLQQTFPGTTTDTTLLSLLLKYQQTKAVYYGDERDYVYRRARLRHVIKQITVLRDECEATWAKIRESRSVQDVTLDQQDTDARIGRYAVVMFFDAPIIYWNAQTFATFFASLISTLFNPHAVLPCVRDDPDVAEPSGGDDASDAEVKQVQGLFGDVLHFLCTDCVLLGLFMNEIICYYHCCTSSDVQKEQTGTVQQHCWHAWKPFKFYNRVIDIWRACLDDIDRKAHSLADKAQLYECIINHNVMLLAEGLGRTQGVGRDKPFPYVLALALMQYQSARLQTLTGELLAKGHELTEAATLKEKTDNQVPSTTMYEQWSLSEQMARVVLVPTSEEEEDQTKRGDELC